MSSTSAEDNNNNKKEEDSDKINEHWLGVADDKPPRIPNTKILGDIASVDSEKLERPVMEPPAQRSNNPDERTITVEEAKHLRVELERVKTVLREHEAVLRHIVKAMNW